MMSEIAIVSKTEIIDPSPKSYMDELSELLNTIFGSKSLKIGHSDCYFSHECRLVNKNNITFKRMEIQLYKSEYHSAHKYRVSLYTCENENDYDSDDECEYDHDHKRCHNFSIIDTNLKFAIKKAFGYCQNVYSCNDCLKYYEHDDPKQNRCFECQLNLAFIENLDSDDKFECYLCCHERSNLDMMSLPCGHTEICLPCLEQTHPQICPQCREPFCL